MKKLRCAIYTRKSTEEGLEQEFNTLDAQRAACEAYILSQAGEGWQLGPEHYDDGGWSGGNMDRPALKKPLNDISVGRIDVVVGSFAKTFGSNGGFVASRNTAFQLLSGSGQAQSSALSPLQAAVILAAFDLVFSPEGSRRRARLMANSLRLRNRLVVEGFHVLGQPGPLVSVMLQGVLFARAMTAEAARRGFLVNLLEAPHVPLHTPRWRLQLMSEHTIADIDRLAEVAVNARALLGTAQAGAAPIFVPTGFADS